MEILHRTEIFEVIAEQLFVQTVTLSGWSPRASIVTTSLF